MQKHISVDIRIVAATNKDLEAEVRAGRFRSDLYFRLKVVSIDLPPLRDRGDDILMLARYFVREFARKFQKRFDDLAPGAQQLFLSYRWPGNVRELKNVVERIVLKTAGRPVRAADLPPELLKTSPSLTETKTAGNGAAADNGDALAQTSRADELAAMMIKHGESFWSAVYPIFMSRDLTRTDLRKIIQIGLETTNGNYRLLVQLFNMAPQDYKRFLSFLRKHDCHLPFQRFRAVPARLQAQRPT